MSGWRAIGLIMARDLRARRKTAAVVTALTVLVAVGGIALARVAGAGGGGTLTGEEADRLLASLGVVILFLALTVTGQAIAEGVAEEKRSRVVEVVLGTVAPRHLLIGKAAALGLIGLLEVVLLVASVVAAGTALDSFPLPRATPGTLVGVIGWFLLGFAFYATAYGAAGAMVAPHESGTGTALPVTLVMMVGYFAGLTAPGADSIVIRVLSFVPPFAPLIMPVRIAFDAAAPWEVALSAALTLAAGYGVIRLAARLYAGALMRGGKVRWRDAWRDAAHLG